MKWLDLVNACLFVIETVVIVHSKCMSVLYYPWWLYTTNVCLYYIISGVTNECLSVLLSVVIVHNKIICVCVISGDYTQQMMSVCIISGNCTRQIMFVYVISGDCTQQMMSVCTVGCVKTQKTAWRRCSTIKCSEYYWRSPFNHFAQRTRLNAGYIFLQSNILACLEC